MLLSNKKHLAIMGGLRRLAVIGERTLVLIIAAGMCVNMANRMSNILQYLINNNNTIVNNTVIPQ